MGMLYGIYTTNSLHIRDGHILPSNSATDLIKSTFRVQQIPDFTITLRWDINAINRKFFNHNNQNINAVPVNERLKIIRNDTVLQRLYAEPAKIAILSPIWKIDKGHFQKDKLYPPSLITIGPYKLSPEDIIVIPYETKIANLPQPPDVNIIHYNLNSFPDNPSRMIVYYNPQIHSLTDVVNSLLLKYGLGYSTSLPINNVISMETIINGMMNNNFDFNSKESNILDIMNNIDSVIFILDHVSELCTRILLNLSMISCYYDFNLKKVLFANLIGILCLLLDNLPNQTQRQYVIDKFLANSHWLNMLLIEMKLNKRGYSLVNIREHLQESTIDKFIYILKDLSLAVPFLMHRNKYQRIPLGVNYNTMVNHALHLYNINEIDLLLFKLNNIENTGFDIQQLCYRIHEINTLFDADGLMTSPYFNVIEHLLQLRYEVSQNFSTLRNNILYQHRVLNSASSTPAELTAKIARRKFRNE